MRRSASVFHLAVAAIAVALSGWTCEQAIPEGGQNRLSNIAYTHSISSHNYADLAFGTEGAVYYATFQTRDRQNHPLLIKTERTGAVQWKKGSQQYGRLFALDADQEGNIWTAGYFEGHFEWEGLDGISGSSDLNGLLMQVDTAGRALDLKRMDGNGLPLYLRTRPNGGCWIAGVFSDSLQIDSLRLFAADESNFIALLDADGNCRMLESTDARITQLAVDPQGNALIAGAFTKSMLLLGRLEDRENDWDTDGFAAKISADSGLLWLKTFGTATKPPDGYQSNDRVSGIDTDAKGNVWISSTEEVDIPRQGIRPRSYLYFFSPEGEREYYVDLADGHSARAPTALTVTDSLAYLFLNCDSDCFMAGEEVLVDSLPATFMLVFDPYFNIVRIEISGPGSDGMMRVGRSDGHTAVFSGHYRSFFRLGTDSLHSDEGGHLLMGYRP